MNLRRVHITMQKCPQGHFSTGTTIRILRDNDEYRKLSAPKNLISFIVWARLIVQLYRRFAHPLEQPFKQFHHNTIQVVCNSIEEN